jgi:hypothetical protein
MNMPADQRLNITEIVDLYNPSGKSHLQRKLILSLVARFPGERWRPEQLQARICSIIDRHVEDMLRRVRVKELVGTDSLDALGGWISQRLDGLFPPGVVLCQIALRYEGGQDVIRDIRNADSQKMIQARSSYPLRTLGVSPGRDVIASARLLQLLLSHETNIILGGRGHSFTTYSDMVSARDEIARSAILGREATFVTFICPPYVKGRDDCSQSGYVGLNRDFSTPPREYGFNYNYHLYLGALEQLWEDAKFLGLRVRPTAVLGDWALVEIDGIRNSLPTDASISATLREFYQSMVTDCSVLYPHVEFSSFQRIGVDRYLPIGLPGSTGARMEWLRDLMHGQFKPWIAAHLLSRLLGICDLDSILTELLDWTRAGKTLVRLGLQCRECYAVVRVYSNIAWIRLREAHGDFTGSPSDPEFKELRRAAMADAIVRWIEYSLYGQLFCSNYGPAVCLFQDDGFTACGNLLRSRQLPILFLNPRSYLQTTYGEQ